MMTVQRLHDLFGERPRDNVLAWSGVCHDCGQPVRVTATAKMDGIHVEGGGVYEPRADCFLVKCDHCHSKDPVLRNFQDCEVYSRVVGYLRPVNQWNDAKVAEFSDRKTFDGALHCSME
jgi:hypothetical protein